MKDGFFFGIDTSNYTTSAAALTTAGEVFCAKRLLPVPPGERGLRQSQALFCHTRDLPEVIGEAMASLRTAYPALPLLAVGVSASPRRVEGSYMPCFLAGVSAASALAQVAGVPLHRLSHQEGHLEAVRFGGRGFSASRFYAFHLSGGTTELLSVKEDGPRYQSAIVARTLDLTLGQLLDRCGVALGLPFPAGAHLEALACKSQGKNRVRIPKKEGGISLSGFENQFQARLRAGESREDLARFLFDVVIAAVRALMEIGRVQGDVLFSGGVSSSRLLQEAFFGPAMHFAPPALCTDNAVGAAALCRKGEGYGS